MSEQQEAKQKPGNESLPNHVQVAVVTTSGTYPEEGFDSVPLHQKVEQVLKQAAKHLKLSATSGWLARVNGKPLDPNKNFVENGLSGQVEIDWGPTESGGGRR